MFNNNAKKASEGVGEFVFFFCLINCVPSKKTCWHVVVVATLRQTLARSPSICQLFLPHDRLFP